MEGNLAFNLGECPVSNNVTGYFILGFGNKKNVLNSFIPSHSIQGEHEKLRELLQIMGSSRLMFRWNIPAKKRKRREHDTVLFSIKMLVLRIKIRHNHSNDSNQGEQKDRKKSSYKSFDQSRFLPRQASSVRLKQFLFNGSIKRRQITVHDMNVTCFPSHKKCRA